MWGEWWCRDDWESVMELVHKHVALTCHDTSFFEKWWLHDINVELTCEATSSLRIDLMKWRWFVSNVAHVYPVTISSVMWHAMSVAMSALFRQSWLCGQHALNFQGYTSTLTGQCRWLCGHVDYLCLLRIHCPVNVDDRDDTWTNCWPSNINNAEWWNGKQ